MGKVTAVDSARFVRLVAGLVSGDPRQREDAGEKAFDLRATLTEDEARSVAMILAHASVLEADTTARESLLHALADYVEWSKAPTSVADVVATLDSSSLVGSEVEYVQYIADPSSG